MQVALRRRALRVAEYADDAQVNLDGVQAALAPNEAQIRGLLAK